MKIGKIDEYDMCNPSDPSDTQGWFHKRCFEQTLVDAFIVWRFGIWLCSEVLMVSKEFIYSPNITIHNI